MIKAPFWRERRRGKVDCTLYAADIGIRYNLTGNHFEFPTKKCGLATTPLECTNTNPLAIQNEAACRARSFLGTPDRP
jgi:hypothetical protein